MEMVLGHDEDAQSAEIACEGQRWCVRGEDNMRGYGNVPDTETTMHIARTEQLRSMSVIRTLLQHTRERGCTSDQGASGLEDESRQRGTSR
jgi:hypothetical protein